MYWVLGVLVFVAWGLERYFKLFSSFAKGIETGLVSAVLLGVFLLIVVAEFINGHWLRSVLLLLLAGIAYFNFRKRPSKKNNENS